MFNSIKTK